MLEHGALALVVGEADVGEGDVALDVLHGPGVGRVDDVRRLVHDGAEALEARHALRELLGEVGQLADGALHAGDVHVERDERGDVHAVFHDEVAAHADDGQAHEVDEEVRAGEKARHDPVIALLGIDVPAGAAGELVDLLVLVAEGLGHADAGDGAFDLGVDAGGALLDLPGDAHHVAAAHGDEQDDERHGDDEHERERGLDAPEHDEGADERHGGDEQVLGAVVRQLGDVEQVGGHAGHEQAGAVLVVEGEAELLHMPEDGGAHVGLDAHAHHMAEVGDDPLCRAAQDIHAEHGEHDEHERAHELIGDVVIEHPAGDDGEEDVHQGDEQRAGHIQQEEAHMRLVEVGELADGAPAGRGLFLKGGAIGCLHGNLQRNQSKAEGINGKR